MKVRFEEKRENLNLDRLHKAGEVTPQSPPDYSTIFLLAIFNGNVKSYRPALSELPPSNSKSRRYLRGSSSAPQRTICTLRRLNPRRLDFTLDLKSELNANPPQPQNSLQTGALILLLSRLGRYQ